MSSAGNLLVDCRPRWLRFVLRDDGYWDTAQVDSLSDAQGIWFWYPDDLPHILAFDNAPADCGFGPGRWHPVGTGFEDLTLDGYPPGSARSVLTRGHRTVHFFVTGGLIENC